MVAHKAGRIAQPPPAVRPPLPTPAPCVPPSDYKLRSSFTATMDKTFLGGYHMVDFANTAKARRTINGWLEGKTRSRIKDVTSCVGPSSPLDSSTRLVLVNALYFKVLPSPQTTRTEPSRTLKSTSPLSPQFSMRSTYGPTKDFQGLNWGM